MSEWRYLSPLEKEDKTRELLHKLGEVLSMTNEPIKDVIYIKGGRALIVLNNGYTQEVNLQGYSPFGMVRQIVLNYED